MVVKDKQAPFLSGQILAGGQLGTGRAAKKHDELGFRPFGILATTRVKSKNLDVAPGYAVFLWKKRY